MSLLEIQHLSKSFGEDHVLSDINLSVDEGDIYGILGLSGAGKSTLVRCINGLENYDEGEIRFEGRLLSSPSQKIARVDRPKIAMIFQGFNLLNQSNVLENVELPLALAHALILDFSRLYYSTESSYAYMTKTNKNQKCIKA